MDTRKWLLLNDLPSPDGMFTLAKYIPFTGYRGPNVLRLFLVGMKSSFKLTTLSGVPTEALWFMAKMMGAEIVRGDQLPPEEQATFGTPGPTLMESLYSHADHHYYLRGITDRIKAANSVSNQNKWEEWADWHFRFLPGLTGEYIRYKDPDGKKRKRVCWIARCTPDWEMTQDVYHGIYR